MPNRTRTSFDLHRAWLYEQAELDYITTKKKVGQLKNLITTRSDDLRVPFGKGTEKQDRAGIMVGTVNGTFLRGDPALRRRFLVIQCPQSFDAGERIDIVKVRRDRDAIWKAAVLAYRAGEPCFLDSETAAAASTCNLQNAEDEHPGRDQSPLGCINPSIGGTTPFRRHPSWLWDCSPWPATRKVTPNRTAQGHGTDRWVEERPQPNPTQRDEASLLAKGQSPGG